MKLNFDELIKQKTINLCGWGLVDTEVDVLYQVIEQSTVLEELDLYGNKLTLSDGKLAKTIANNTTLKELYLQSNTISQRGAKLLADALKNNNVLQELYLGGNNIGDEGAKYLADMLAANKTLQAINLSLNGIGDKGAKSIATSLVVNTGIQMIRLQNNKIGDNDAEKLADALESNHSIKSLCLDGNNISNHIMERIKAILNNPKRKEIIELKLVIAEKDKKLEVKDTEIAKKDRDLAKKDKQITSLKAAIRGQLQQLETILDPVDLTKDDERSEPPNKRARTEEDTPKSALAVQHEQNKQHNQRLVQVKQEKNTAEAALDNVRGQKQAVEANLEEAREELEDAEELVGQQTIATNIWQGRFDELVSLAEAAGVDGAAISGIRNRSLASGS